MRVRELAEWLGSGFEGDGETVITAVAPIEAAGSQKPSVSFDGNLHEMFDRQWNWYCQAAGLPLRKQDDLVTLSELLGRAASGAADR